MKVTYNVKLKNKGYEVIEHSLWVYDDTIV